MKKLFFVLLISILTMPFAFAQTADQLLAQEILANDGDPTNDVADATQITNAGAVISAAPPAAVQNAVSAVTSANPGVGSQVAAAAAGNNAGVSIAQAASSAGVSTAAVVRAAAGSVGRTVSSSRGTGAGSSAGGGSPSAEDIAKAIEDNPDLIGDVLPGLSEDDIAVLEEAIESGGSVVDIITSGAGGTQG